jgi:hypothetical protein
MEACNIFKLDKLVASFSDDNIKVEVVTKASARDVETEVEVEVEVDISFKVIGIVDGKFGFNAVVPVFNEFNNARVDTSVVEVVFEFNEFNKFVAEGFPIDDEEFNKEPFKRAVDKLLLILFESKENVSTDVTGEVLLSVLIRVLGFVIKSELCDTSFSNFSNAFAVDELVIVVFEFVFEFLFVLVPVFVKAVILDVLALINGNSLLTEFITFLIVVLEPGVVDAAVRAEAIDNA